LIAAAVGHEDGGQVMAIIRGAEHDDRQPVLDLWEQCGLEPAADDEWRALLGTAHAVLLAQEGDRVVGSVVATFDGWRAYIYHVAVAPAERRQGLGRQLMDAAEDYLREAGARRIFIEVHQDNTEGLALGASIGYLPAGELVLEKELTTLDAS
jgi:ribosomal protein S18 acetylase RimI-like enzyme